MYPKSMPSRLMVVKNFALIPLDGSALKRYKYAHNAHNDGLIESNFIIETTVDEKNRTAIK